MATADVLLSTLSSRCVLAELRHYSDPCLPSVGREVDRLLVQGHGTSRSTGVLRPVSVCIVDEASQCVEPEVLIPLRLGFSKMVMVRLPCCSTSSLLSRWATTSSSLLP